MTLSPNLHRDLCPDTRAFHPGLIKNGSREAVRLQGHVVALYNLLSVLLATSILENILFSTMQSISNCPVFLEITTQSDVMSPLNKGFLSWLVCLPV